MKHPLMMKVAFFLAVTTMLVFAPAPVTAVTQIFEVQVNASENDAEESGFGVVTLTSADLDLGGLYRKVGLRFANVTIQKNAPITRAYIEFATASQDSTSTTFTIEAVAQDNPAVFTTGGFNISARPVYSQSVDWAMNYAWLTTDEVHQSADITALVQKLVNRSGWASGNAMAFVISNGRMSSAKPSPMTRTRPRRPSCTSSMRSTWWTCAFQPPPTMCISQLLQLHIR